MISDHNGTREELRYSAADGTALTGVLSLPSGSGPFPLLIAIPGGAWRSSTPAQLDRWGRWLSERGYAVFALQYRTCQEGKSAFPDALDDVVGAIDFIRNAAEQYRLDPGRTGLLGASAGAHLAALAALGEHKGPFPRIATLIGVYGIYDLAALWQQLLRDHEPAGRGICRQFLGGELYDDQQRYFAASPLKQVTYSRCAGLDAFLIWGTDDDAVDFRTQSKPFARALRQARANIRTLPVHGAGHFWFSREPPMEAGTSSAFVAPHILRFLDSSPMSRIVVDK